MSTAAVSGLFCCCFGMCCSEIATACNKLIGTRKLTQLAYILIVILFMLPVVFITFLLDKLQKLISITPSSIVLRMSLALFLLFILILIILICRNRFSQIFNEGLFFCKYLLLLAIFAGCLFVPQNIIDLYGQIGKIVSFVYLIAQVIILIDIYYLVATRLKSRYDEGQTCCGGLLIGCTIITVALALLLNLLTYIWYSNDSCGNVIWPTILTSILFLLLPTIQLLNFNPQGSLLTTSLILLTISYNIFSAQEYYNDSCTIRLTKLGYTIELIISLGLFIITTYGTIMGGFSRNEYQIQEEERSDSLEEYTEHWGWVRWHCYMLIGVVYLGMVFSNWQQTDRIAQNLQGSMLVFWLKTTIAWTMAIFYIWSLIAPKIFPEKHFNTDQ